MNTSLAPEIQELLTEQALVRDLVAKLDKQLPPDAQISLEDALPLLSRQSRETVNLIAAYRVAESLRGLRREHVRQLERAAERVAAEERARDEAAAKALQDKENESKGILPNVKHGSTNKKNGGVRFGCQCEWCCDIRQADKEIEQVHEAALQNILDHHVKTLRIKWTAELLDSSFAMPDGTLVLWGDATAEQHAKRVVMLHNNVRANAEAAARHQHAIRLLEETGAEDLRHALPDEELTQQG